MGRKAESWRAELKRRYGQEVWGLLAGIARGDAWQSKLPDGRLSQPISPTAADRVSALKLLAAYINGAPVPETEIARAEAAQSVAAHLASLPEDELERLLACESDAEIIEAVAGALPATVESK